MVLWLGPVGPLWQAASATAACTSAAAFRSCRGCAAGSVLAARSTWQFGAAGGQQTCWPHGLILLVMVLLCCRTQSHTSCVLECCEEGRL